MRTVSAEKSSTVTVAEAKSLFSDLKNLPTLVLAVSGGPDSTALMVLATRWRKALKAAPTLIAVTVDHGLRAESKREASSVARLARKLGITHRSLRWTGNKPKTGLPQAARLARYNLLGQAARKLGASHILTAHTLDDQAETVLIRMSRGSGVTGLRAMARISKLPGSGEADIKLVRPLLEIPKSRLIATLVAAKITFADDLSNRDPRFTRARLRGLMPQLAQEGLDARRLSLLASRIRRADEAIEAAVDQAMVALQAMADLSPDSGELDPIVFDAEGYARLPAEIALRLTGRAMAKLGCEGPVELGKLEALNAALDAAQKAGQKTGKVRFRRSLAGAMVTLSGGEITVERAPPRRANSLTKRRGPQAKRPKAR